jgi:hypothetical protein
VFLCTVVRQALHQIPFLEIPYGVVKCHPRGELR